MRDWIITSVILLWAVPMALFWGWYGLSVNDLNFGTIFLSRELNEVVFRVYGNTLGVDPQAVPAMIAGACAFDTAIVAGIASWRWRNLWYPGTSAFIAAQWYRYGPKRAGEADELVPTALPDGPAHPAE